MSSRVVGLEALFIHVYSEKRTQTTYRNENLGGCGNIFLARTRDADSRTQVSLVELWHTRT